ncbi:hypothetical protein [Streptomyces sp. NRRL F-5135]|uniref:SCO2583 family membrane protein n=1 Tax=Streptomyces sp. NRRL F-5135 TaxID=1463858 RepID=UPI0004CB73AB|nr:hypothetical protein [Streptomyces sp. NRRL F-5135]
MAGRGDPPEGEPEGLPGGDDEYRSVVFDESFIRAARLKEYSAKERMGDHAHAVRRVPPPPPPHRRGRPARVFRNGPRQFLMLVLVIVLAFGTAVYLGVRSPYRPPVVGGAAQARMSVIPLAPQGPVPGGAPEDLFAHSPAAQFRVGAAGITLPAAHGAGDFSESQVTAALTTVKDYLVASSLDPDVLAGRTVRPVRVLLDPGQQTQFDSSFAAPADDGRHAPVGWLVRFDPGKVAQADSQVRVHGTLRYEETAPGTLEVTADHLFVYALRPAGAHGLPVRDASLFTVRRELRFRIDMADLPKHSLELLSSETRAGPQDCSAEPPGTLRPLLEGQRAKPDDPAGTDPYTTGPSGTGLCGTLSRAAEPTPTAPAR